MMRPATTEQPNPTARPTALSCCLSPGGRSFGSRNDCESYHNASTATTNSGTRRLHCQGLSQRQCALITFVQHFARRSDEVIK